MMHENIIKYHNANAIVFTLQSESFHHAVNDRRRGLRHKNIIERRGAAVFGVSPGWVEFTLHLLSLTIPGERVEG